MTTFLYSVLGFVLAIGILTTVHEYGHFWVARRMGVKVLRFSIGFGKPLIAWHDKLGTEYVIAAIPLGGYVKMVDQNEGVVAQSDLHLAFNNKPVWARMLIIGAGPAFNLFFAILAYWVVFMSGTTSLVPVLGDVPKGSAAYVAGLHSGEEIIAVDKHPTASWEDIAVALASHLGDHDFVTIKTRDINNSVISDHVVNLSNWAIDSSDENILKNLGLEPLDPIAPIVGKVMPDMPAASAGLEPGDLILSVDGKTVSSRSALLEALHSKYDHAVHLMVQRKNETISLLITPVKKIQEGGEATGFIGIQFENQPLPKNMVRTQTYSALQALRMSVDRTAEYSILTLQFLGKMATGKISLQHVAGPISIAKFAGQTVRIGFEYFLGFMALVSISLGVLNMLPIPVLDGGHFMFCMIEMVRGKALSSRAMNVGHMVGFVVLGSFMILAIYNDIVRVIS